MNENSPHKHVQESKEAPSFNSVTEHNRLFGGNSVAPIDIKALPKPIRWFAYFVSACVFAGGLILLFKLAT